MKSSKNRDRAIDKLLTRGVVEVIEKDKLTKALKSGRKLRVKLGIDPTSPDLHLGHAVVLRKLREFQDLGHKIVLIIGDFTAMIGDPSGNIKARPPLSPAQIKKNMKDYVKQAGKIIDLKKAEIQYNSKWLLKLDAKEILKTLALVSVNHVLERDDFEKRLTAGKPLGMHELLYPIYQAYDSVAVKADVEIGGTDQTFNLLMGRELMSKTGMKPQDIVTVPLLEGTDGKEKMSKSLGNYIGLSEEPKRMFDKVVSLPDSLTDKYLELCTDIESKSVKGSARARKSRLAYEIVKIYHGGNAAEKVKSELPTIKLKFRTNMLEAVLKTGLTKSRSEARNLILEGRVALDSKTIKLPTRAFTSRSGQLLKVGKKTFLVRTS